LSTFEKPILWLLRSILFASLATNMFHMSHTTYRLADRPLPDDNSFEYLLSLKSNAHNALSQAFLFSWLLSSWLVRPGQGNNMLCLVTCYGVSFLVIVRSSITAAELLLYSSHAKAAYSIALSGFEFRRLTPNPCRTSRMKRGAKSERR